MTIFIRDKQWMEEDAINFICQLNETQIVRAWCRSNVDHEFKSVESFRGALARNRTTLASQARVKTFFIPNNYLFSTEAKHRKETLYFGDGTITGRLRQQHEKGPLVKIDDKRKEHRFVSKNRLEVLKRCRRKDACQIPTFRDEEQQAKDGRHHIEFPPWHISGGTVVVNRQQLDRRIASALESLAGIR